jgi:hypothetical protein
MKFKIFLILSLLLSLSIARRHKKIRNPENNEKDQEDKSDKNQPSESKDYLISSEDQHYIVKTHNYYRNMVASGNVSGNEGLSPPAKNMLQMYWHEKLAVKAQELAKKCKNAHSGINDRSFSEMPFLIGENFEMAGKEDQANWAGVLGKWFNQVSNFKNRQVLMKTVDQTSNLSEAFTQIVWARSYMVGCGISLCDDNLLYLCLYGPGGNVTGESIYLPAVKPQLQCPVGTMNSQLYPKLCCPRTLCGKGIIEWSGPFINFSKKKKRRLFRK